MGGEAFPAVQESQLDQEVDSSDLCADFFDEGGGGSGGAPRGEKVIYDHNAIARLQGILVHFDFRLPVFEVVGLADRFVGEFPFFADRDEGQAQLLGEDRPEEEAARFDARDFCRFCFLRFFHEKLHGGAEECRVAQDRGDIFEDNPRLGKIRDVADGDTQGFDFFRIHSFALNPKGLL